MVPRRLIFPLLIPLLALAQKYDGPRPEKKDFLYILHADTLVPTEAGEAKEEGKKDSPVYTVAGASSSARTPLAEPIFILDSETIKPDQVELYRFDVKGGHREVKVGRRGGAKPLRLTVTRLEKGLYKLEASETLENGEYSLSPNGSNRVFCFTVY